MIERARTKKEGGSRLSFAFPREGAGYAVYFQARSSINIEKNSSTLARGSRPRVLYTGADRKREADTRAMMIIALARARARVASLDGVDFGKSIDRSFRDFSQQMRRNGDFCLLRRTQIRTASFSTRRFISVSSHLFYWPRVDVSRANLQF